MSTEQATAFCIRGPGEGELVDVDLTAPGAEEVRVRTLHSGVSRGTERLVFNGKVPSSQHATMRAPFQRGEFPGPVIYGYSNVGVVEAGPEALLGRSVFCLFPHQTAYVAPATAVVPLPEAVPAARAVLAANMETAVNALWDAGPRVGDRISVIGGGTLGCLVARLCAELPGTSVEVIDVEPQRAPVVAALGAVFRRPGEASAERDLVFHTSATEAGLRQALACAGREAAIIELSWFGTRSVELPLGEAFHSGRLRLCSSQVGTVAPARAAQRSHRDRLVLALDLLADPVYERLIDSHSDFADLPATMARIAAGGAGSLCHRIDYPGP